MTYILLLVGFGFLIRGADLFVEGASAIAKKLGVPSLVIGLTLVALGTSAPEVAVSIKGSLAGANGITIGNIVGSNIFNVLVVAGGVAIFYPLTLDQGMLKYGLPFFVGSALLTGVFSFDQFFSRTEGLILLALLVTYLVLLVRGQLKDQSEDFDSSQEETPSLSWLKAIVFSVVGLAGVLLGGDWVVDNATILATQWGWSEDLIGLTIVAIGTSLPELMTSFISTRKGEIGIALGNVMGSNILNTLFVLGASSAILPIPMTEGTQVDLWFMIIITLLMGILTFTKKQLNRWEGIILMLLYIGYTLYLMSTI